MIILKREPLDSRGSRVSRIYLVDRLILIKYVKKKMFNFVRKRSTVYQNVKYIIRKRQFDVHLV